MDTNKPTIRYNPSGVVYIKVGEMATVNAVDHPNFSYGQLIWTSYVIDYDEDSGVFETLNTIYVPSKGEEQQ